MILSEAQIKFYRTIEDSGPVKVDPKITVLVGQNESGKTAFLQALYKTNPVEETVKFDVTEDYPRKSLLDYEDRHETDPAIVAELTYTLTQAEVDRINAGMKYQILEILSFRRLINYNGKGEILIDIPEADYIQSIVRDTSLPADIKAHSAAQTSLKNLIGYLSTVDLSAEGKTFLDGLQASFGESTWANCLEWYIWKNFLLPHLPKFLFFDDYYLLPGKINLSNLNARVMASDQDDQPPLTSEEKTVVSLLQMAGVEIKTLTDTSGYEKIKAKLEGISNSITDKIFTYWTQNKELDVEFDLRSDAQDQPPYNNGTNLYIRIRNRRHRVTVPFSQRSKGFIWFFSFIVWFSSIKKQVPVDTDLILLLDEPGLSLHALAQHDFLKYMDTLSESNQLLYTTHSPFMVPSGQLFQVRTVEDQGNDGTKVSDSLTGSDPKTVFPLQAALGYEIAQNLFAGKRNLLVAGVADLVYLQFFSMLLAQADHASLREGITIVPTGGLDKIATFLALLQGDKREFRVLQGYESPRESSRDSLVREKLIRDKQVLNYALYRSGTTDSSDETFLVNTDIEDLLSPALYLELFNAANAKELQGLIILEADLPAGDRIIERINLHLQSQSVRLGASGGFDRYAVAAHLATHPVPISQIDAATLANFEKLFRAVNRLFLDH